MERKIYNEVKKVNILKLYQQNKTYLRAYLKNKNLKDILSDIQKEKLTNDLVLRTDIGYPLRRKNTNEKLERKFVDSNKRIAPEHAQKFYLYSHSKENKNKSDQPFGYIFTYELPFFKNRSSGAIDLVGYNDDKNIINLIEMKNCKMGPKESSKESLIRAILEIETYSKFINEIIKNERKNGELGELFEEIRRTLKKDFDLEISKEKLLKCKIKKNLLIPRTLYEYSKNENKIEKEILYEIPNDINIYSINLKDTNFNVSQKIGDVAKRNDIIFDIKLIK